jgi:anti-sigma factor (TIGR02949 family)
MRCDEVQEKLNAYYDGEVKPEVRMKIEEHLRGCPECRQVQDSLKQLGQLLNRISIPPVPEELAMKIMTKAGSVLTGSPPDLYSSRRIVTWWQSVSPAARTAAAAVILLGLGLGLLTGRDICQNHAQIASPSTLDGLDYLTEAPTGSLPEVYLRLTAEKSTGRK